MELVQFWLIGIVFLSLTSIFVNGNELQCDFYDSINITTGAYHPNRSIIFNGLEFPPEANYYLKHGFNRMPVPKPYTYDCLCNTKPCLRLCCPFGSFVEVMEPGKRIKCRENVAAKHLKREIIDDNNYSSLGNSDEHFIYSDRICNLPLVVEDFEIDKVII